VTGKLRLVLIAAIAAVSLASPALAQPDLAPTTGSASNQSEHMLGFYDSGSRNGQVSFWAGAKFYARSQRNPQGTYSRATTKPTWSTTARR
jgi:hypothetical protein